MNKQDIQDLIVRLRFVQAKSMPNIPHEYVVRNDANDTDYRMLFDAIGMFGVNEKFYSKTYQYLYMEDGFKYWRMTDDINESKIINRARW